MNKTYLLALSMAISSFFTSQAHSHGGGLDENGCHNVKSGGRHCHEKKDKKVKESKYIPDSESVRLQKLHDTVCAGVAGDANSRPRYDYYGKPCR